MFALRRILGLLALLLAPVRGLAQQERPTLAAHSRTVDIQDGPHLWKGIWTIDPTLPLDTYHARRSGAPKTVTFVSDVDSRAFVVEPGKEYDFVVLLDGKDACRTRISTLRQPYRRAAGASGAAPDAIPFRLVDGRILVEASVNGSRPLELMFDTGADNLVLHPSALRKGVQLEFDGSMANAGLGGSATRRTSSANRLEIAGLAWEHELVLYVENRTSDCDGILGYIAFEDKVLELDYERSVLRVHDALPPNAAGFASFPFRYQGTIPAMEVGFETATSTGTGWFVIDTGSSATLHLDQAFGKKHDLYEKLESFGTSESRGVGPGVLHNRIALVPRLVFGDVALENVPAHLAAPGQDAGLSTGCLLGMEVLERFDTLLDFQHDRVYLRPSAHFAEPFELRAGDRQPRAVLLVCGGVLALVAILGAVWGRSKSRGVR